MPLQIVRNDITKMKVDAIVNAANKTLLGGGGVDGAIHRTAGPELLEACRALGGCETGEAKLTPGFRLPCRFVILSVGPVWQDGQHGEREQLAACYRNALRLALAQGCASIAFPLISTGAYGFPKAEGLQIATEEIRRFLMEQEMLVYLVVFDRRAYQIGSRLYAEIAAYIDDCYAETHLLRRRAAMPMECASMAAPMSAQKAAPCSLQDALRTLDESFSEMLLRKISERGMTDAQCYKKANIDRKLFSKIRSDKNYKPSKPTVLAFALALELPLPELREMLEKAGFSLTHASKFDIIVEYFVAHGNYNVFEINEALFAFDQSLIGA